MKYICLVIALLTTNCSTKTVADKVIGNFNISPDDGNILFSYLDSGKSSIYEYSFQDSSIKCILPANETCSYYNPAYSLKGDQIVFIKPATKNNLNSELCVADIDGKNNHCVLKASGIITEAFFSGPDEIIFCKANEYAKYSPIGIKASHDFDLYSFSMSNKKLSKITDLKAYALSHVFKIGSTKLMFELITGEQEGIYMLDIQRPGEISKFEPYNDPRNEIAYSAPAFSPKYKSFAFADSYELYFMSSMNGRAIFVTRDNSIYNNIKFFNKYRKIVATTQGNNSFFVIDLMNKKKEALPVIID